MLTASILGTRAERRNTRKPVRPTIVRHGNHWLVFVNGRLERRMAVIEGGADKSVRVRLEALVAGYQASLASAAASTKAFGANVLTTASSNRAAFTTVGLAGAAMGGAILLGFKSAVGAAVDFESSFAGVRKTVDATESEFEALSQGLRDMATQIPVNVNELNRIAEAAGQLGIKKEAILDFTRTMADLGVTTNLSSDEAATALARLANITQMPQTEFDRLGSTVVDLGNKLATTEAEIVEMGTRIAGAGEIAGLTEPQILAIGAAMSSVGIQAESGGTATQKALLSIVEAVTTGSDKLDVFASTAGMSAEQFASAWREDAATAFLAFVEGLGASGEEGIAILKALGLNNERTRTAFLSLAGAGDVLSEALEIGTTAWEENTALTKEAEQRYDTTASKVQLAKNEINDLAISIGNVIKSGFEKVITMFGDFAGVVNQLPDPLRNVAIGIGGISGAALALGGAMLLLLPRIADTKAALATLEIQAGLTNAALSAGALGIIIAAYYGLDQAVRGTAEGVAELGNQSRSTSGLLGEGAGRSLEQAEAHEKNKAALHALAEQLAGTGATGQDVWHKMEFLTAALKEMGLAALTASPEEFQEALAKIAPTADDTTDATEDLTDKTSELEAALEEAETAADKLTIALDELMGGTLDTEKASLSWLDSLKSLADAIKDNGGTLDKNTQKGRDNRDAVLSSIDAALEHAKAVTDQTGSVEKGSKVFGDHIKQLMGVAEQSGISKEAIGKYLKELNLTPKDVKTLLKLLGVERSINELNAIRDAIDAIPSQKTVDVLINQLGDPGGKEVKHSGGMAGATGATRYHSGSLPMRGDEVPAILQRGEMVLSKAQVATFGQLFAGRSTPAPGGQEINYQVEITGGSPVDRAVVREEIEAANRDLVDQLRSK